MEKELEDKIKSIITDNGILTSGNGIVINLLESIDKRLDRNNFLLSKIEQKIDRIIELK